MTFRNLSRYSSYHEKTFARWYARGFDFGALNKAAITAVVPPEHAQALVMDASFVPKSGKATSGLDRFWNGRHSRTEKGLEISALAWLAITDNCAYCLNRHLIERILQHLAVGHSLEKSSPAYKELCNYGTITAMAA